MNLRVLYLFIFGILLFFSSCNNLKEEKKIIGVKMYELKESPETLIQKWINLGINTAFVSKEVARTKEFRNRCSNEGIEVFIIFPIFYNSKKLQQDSTLFAITNEGKIAKDEWVEFICPSNKNYREEIIDSARKIVKETNPNGLSLDFIRHFVFWEKIDPQYPVDSIKETCYCYNCVDLFLRQIKIKLPDTVNSTKLIAKWILLNYYDEWVKWKESLITSLVQEITLELKKEDSDLKFNLHAVPWRKADYNGAINSIVGQNFKSGSKYVDYISPMCYTHMLYRQPQWIDSIITDLDNSKAGILPSIQVKECYRLEKFELQDFEKCIYYALKEPSKGIVFWSWDYLEQEPDKKEIIKKICN